MEITIIRVTEAQEYIDNGYTVFRVDRKSPVGSPYYLRNSSERDIVCDNYQKYFDAKIAEATDSQFMGYLDSIYEKACQGPVALSCWCVPRRCHAETIRNYLLSKGA